MKAVLLEMLACPDCKYSPLEFQNAVFRDGEVDAGQIVCPNCENEFDIVQGVPVLLPTTCNASAATAGVDMEKSAEQHKQSQIDYFNSIGTSEFEITRPRNTGRLYQALLDYKAERSLRLMGAELNGATVLCVCCGSGMDLEYLQDQGSKVVGMDISLGAVLGAKERARRFGLEYDLVVGDAEHLPFCPDSFDFGYVHDGLHHLSSPYKGLCELWRASRRAIVLTEPADAFLTRISILLGISGIDEEAGNKVCRLKLTELKTNVTQLEPKSVTLTRYVMWYPHQPPRWFVFFNLEHVFRTYWYMFSLVNHVIGKWGNKLTGTIWKGREIVQR
jgi:SAM-dependent methyltransferase/uncharacterized protein YbaR (Trm112 family)